MTWGHADVRKLTMPYYGGGVYPPIHLGREGARIGSRARTVSEANQTYSRDLWRFDHILRVSSDITSWVLSTFWSDDRNTCLMICQCVLHGGSAYGFGSPLVLSSWIGGLAFDGWTLQVGCLVLVVSIGQRWRPPRRILEYAAPRTFAKWGLNTQMFKSSVGAAQLLLAEGGIRFLGITTVDVKESSFSNKSHVLEEPGSGELGFKRWSLVPEPQMIASADIRWGARGMRSVDLHGRRLWHVVVKLLGGRVQWIGSDEGVWSRRWSLRSSRSLGPLPTVTTCPVLSMARSSFRVGMAIEDHSPWQDLLFASRLLSLFLLRFTHLSRHNVVAPVPAAPTVDRHMSVSSGVRYA